jgi:thioredoxin-related protein
MMLQIGGFYGYYLKGSVIPFISVDDCRNTLKKGLKSSDNIANQMQKHIKAVEVISKKEKELQIVIDKMSVLKVAYIRNCFKIMQNKEA